MGEGKEFSSQGRELASCRVETGQTVLSTHHLNSCIDVGSTLYETTRRSKIKRPGRHSEGAGAWGELALSVEVVGGFAGH